MAINAPVTCMGRRGRKRVRVNQCLEVLCAEDLYSDLLSDRTKQVGPGSRGTVECRVGGSVHTANWEVRANAVWTFGRVFFFCPRCQRRCSRLYVPCASFWPFACRTCCGLTYTSQSQLNYKNSLWGRGQFARMWGMSQRDYAYEITSELRSNRRKRSRVRWAKRRPILEAWRKRGEGSEDAR